MKPPFSGQILVLPDGRELPIYLFDVSPSVFGGVGVPCVSTTALEFPPRAADPAAPKPRHAPPTLAVTSQSPSPRKTSRRAAYVAAIARCADVCGATVDAWLAHCEIPPRARQAIERAASEIRWDGRRAA